MKLSKNLVYLLLIVGAFSFSGCTLQQMIKMSKDQDLKTEPAPLELHGGKVAYNMSARLPVKMMKKGTTYTLDMTYNYGEKSAEAGSAIFVADDFPNSNNQEPEVAKTFSFDYNSEMERGELNVQGTAAKGKKSKQTPVMKLTDGVITTSLLVMDGAYLASYAGHGYGQIKPTSEHIEFYFQQGSSALSTSEKNSTRGQFLDAFIAEKNADNTVKIIGSHSPEGPESINSKLSEDRAKVIEKYYRKKMKEYDYGDLADNVNFEIIPIFQNWGAFKEALAGNTSLSQAEKNQVLEIVNGSGTFREKERELQSLNFYNKHLLNEIYPPLRVAKTEVLVQAQMKADPQISATAKQIISGQKDAGALTEEELMYAASLTPDLEEREKLYVAATKKYDSWSSHNNLGAVYLEMANREVNTSKRNEYISKAESHLAISKNRKESAEVYTNMAVAELMKGGNEESAMANLNKAVSLNPSEYAQVSLKGAKGVLDIKTGQYDAAVADLKTAGDSPAVLYNLALAYLLKKDHGNAKTGFDKAIAADSKNSWAYYCAAITGARTGNISHITSNLSKAISLDSELGSKAGNDLEFMKYWESDEFQSVVQ